MIGWMYYQVAFVPGGQAIGFLESFYAKVGRQLRKIFGRRRLKGVVPEREFGDLDDSSDAPLQELSLIHI